VSEAFFAQLWNPPLAPVRRAPFSFVVVVVVVVAVAVAVAVAVVVFCLICS
jgi:hypothetical protein